MKRILLPLAIVTAAAAGMVLTNPAAHVVQAADPDRSIDDLELSIASRTYTAEYMTRDSDGDGWSDWYERLQGTDPNDPASRPGAVHLDIAHVDGATTVFVQSSAFPDHLVALDGLELPERVDSIGQFLDLVSQLTGQTTLGTFRDELDSAVKDAGGGDRLASMLADVSKHHGSVDIAMGGRTAGHLTALISAGGYSIGISFSGDGVRITETSDSRDPTGTGHVGVVVSLNGTRESTTHREYKDGVLVFSQTTDAGGSVVDANVTPLSDATTAAPTTVKSDPAETTTVPDKPSTTTATTTKGDYVNPDDDSTMFQVPTLAEAAARLKFLGGVRARYGGVLDIPTEIPKDEPGVHDPAEPPCEQDRCVAFTEITAPDLSRTSGGCPPTYCTAGRP
jgi:Bacterial TSP3 repeat